MNIRDHFKGKSVDQIRKEVQEATLPFAVCMMQLTHDFNFGTVVRNANVFGAREVFYYGPKRKWDRRGSVGTHHYTDVIHLPLETDLSSLREKYPNWVALEILDGVSSPIESHEWREGTLLFVGEETDGLPKEILDQCDQILHISQRGSCRSLNAGTASGIAMHLISIALGE